MEWWQILLVFAGIPIAMFVAIALLVLHFASSRVPDGLARAAEAADEAAGDEPDSRAHQPASVEPGREEKDQ